MTKPRIRVQAKSRKTGDVVVLNQVTSHDIPVSRVLAGAAELSEVVVLGYTADGAEYFASSKGSGSDVLWLLERFKMELLHIGPQDLPPAADNPEGIVLPFKPRAP